MAGEADGLLPPMLRLRGTNPKRRGKAAGRADKAEGMVECAISGLHDAMRDALKT